jgi:hypothetical protein
LSADCCPVGTAWEIDNFHQIAGCTLFGDVIFCLALFDGSAF